MPIVPTDILRRNQRFSSVPAQNVPSTSHEESYLVHYLRRASSGSSFSHDLPWTNCCILRELPCRDEELVKNPESLPPPPWRRERPFRTSFDHIWPRALVWRLTITVRANVVARVRYKKTPLFSFKVNTFFTGTVLPFNQSCIIVCGMTSAPFSYQAGDM